MGVKWQDLVPVLAHDARALVRKGITNAQLLERITAPEAGSPEQVHLQAVIESQQGLNRLFARLVDLADAENPEKMRGEAMDLQTAILAAKLDCKQSLTSAQAEFAVGEVPGCRVPKRTQAVLRELIDNTVRFAHESRALRVNIQAELGDSLVRVQVTDTGVGIETAYIDKLFQPLQRLDSVRSGFGLGLAICRSIVEASDGRIYCQPCESGAMFAFEVPVS